METEIKMIIKSLEDLEYYKRQHEERIQNLEQGKAENREQIKSITLLMQQQNKSIEKMSEEIKLLVLKPLQTYEKVKLGVYVAIATAVVIAWLNL